MPGKLRIGLILALLTSLALADETSEVLLPGDINLVNPLLSQYVDYRALILSDERDEAKLLAERLTSQVRLMEGKLLAFARRSTGIQLDAAYFLLGLAGSNRAKGFLEEQLAKGSAEERAAAAKALAAGNPSFSEKLKALAQSKEPVDRRIAAIGLGSAGPSSAQTLMKLTADTDRSVRLASYLSLAELGTGECEGFLFSLTDKTTDPIDRVALFRAISLATHIETTQMEMRALVLAQGQLDAIRSQSEIVSGTLTDSRLEDAAAAQQIVLETVDELILRLQTKLSDEAMQAAPGELSPEMAAALSARARMQAMQAALTPSQGPPSMGPQRARSIDFSPAEFALRPLVRSVDWGRLPGVDAQTVANALSSKRMPERYKQLLRAYYRALAESERAKGPRR